MSSATNEVATLRRGMLNNFDTMLKIDMETPAEANSREPAGATSDIRDRERSLTWCLTQP